MSSSHNLTFYNSRKPTSFFMMTTNNNQNQDKGNEPPLIAETSAPQDSQVVIANVNTNTPASLTLPEQLVSYNRSKHVNE